MRLILRLFGLDVLDLDVTTDAADPEPSGELSGREVGFRVVADPVIPSVGAGEE